MPSPEKPFYLLKSDRSMLVPSCNSQLKTEFSYSSSKLNPKHMDALDSNTFIFPGTLDTKGSKAIIKDLMITITRALGEPTKKSPSCLPVLTYV